MHVGMSEVLRERNDLVAARQHLLASKEIGEHAGLPQEPVPLAGRHGPAAPDRR